jgi:hypothetical protein
MINLQPPTRHSKRAQHLYPPYFLQPCCDLAHWWRLPLEHTAAYCFSVAPSLAYGRSVILRWVQLGATLTDATSSSWSLQCPSHFTTLLSLGHPIPCFNFLRTIISLQASPRSLNIILHAQVNHNATDTQQAMDATNLPLVAHPLVLHHRHS